MAQKHATFPSPAARGSTADELEQRRLAHRAARLRDTLCAMQQLVDGRAAAVPRPLRHGIDDFSRELSRVQQRLRELDRVTPS